MQFYDIMYSVYKYHPERNTIMAYNGNKKPTNGGGGKGFLFAGEIEVE